MGENEVINDLVSDAPNYILVRKSYVDDLRGCVNRQRKTNFLIFCGCVGVYIYRKIKENKNLKTENIKLKAENNRLKGDYIE